MPDSDERGTQASDPAGSEGKTPSTTGNPASDPSARDLNSTEAEKTAFPKIADIFGSY